MPIRSGAMQRPRGCRCGNTLRQRYDEVGLPCSSTMGSPFPTSTYAISRPKTRRRRFWYGNAALLVGVRDIAMLMKALLLGWRRRARRRTTHCERRQRSRLGGCERNGAEGFRAREFRHGMPHRPWRYAFELWRLVRPPCTVRCSPLRKRSIAHVSGRHDQRWQSRSTLVYATCDCGKGFEPPTCEPQSNYSLDELAHDAAPIEDGRLRPAHAAVSVGGEAGPV